MANQQTRAPIASEQAGDEDEGGNKNEKMMRAARMRNILMMMRVARRTRAGRGWQE
jgi:hypothetical protein